MEQERDDGVAASLDAIVILVKSHMIERKRRFRLSVCFVVNPKTSAQKEVEIRVESDNKHSLWERAFRQVIPDGNVDPVVLISCENNTQHYRGEIYNVCVWAAKHLI